MDVVFKGRLGQAADVKASQGGPYVNFTVAEGYKAKKTDKEYSTRWWSCVAFGRIAEACDGLQKGTQVLVVGYISTEHWIDKTTGEKREKNVVIVNDMGVVPVGPRSEGGGNNGGFGSSVMGGSNNFEEEEDVPF